MIDFNQFEGASQETNDDLRRIQQSATMKTIPDFDCGGIRALVNSIYIGRPNAARVRTEDGRAGQYCKEQEKYNYEYDPVSIRRSQMKAVQQSAFVFVAIFLLAAAQTAAEKKGQIVNGWGEVIDPDGDC